MTRQDIRTPSKKDSISFDKPPLQIIATARQWSGLMKEFSKQCMTDPYVCIGSYMEAAVYGRIKPKLCTIQSKLKLQKVAGKRAIFAQQNFQVLSPMK